MRGWKPYGGSNSAAAGLCPGHPACYSVPVAVWTWRMWMVLPLLLGYPSRPHLLLVSLLGTVSCYFHYFPHYYYYCCCCHWYCQALTQSFPFQRSRPGKCCFPLILLLFCFNCSQIYISSYEYCHLHLGRTRTHMHCTVCNVWAEEYGLRHSSSSSSFSLN